MRPDLARASDIFVVRERPSAVSKLGVLGFGQGQGLSFALPGPHSANTRKILQNDTQFGGANKNNNCSTYVKEITANRSDSSKMNCNDNLEDRETTTTAMTTKTTTMTMATSAPRREATNSDTR